MFNGDIFHANLFRIVASKDTHVHRNRVTLDVVWVDVVREYDLAIDQYVQFVVFDLDPNFSFAAWGHDRLGFAGAIVLQVADDHAVVPHPNHRTDSIVGRSRVANKLTNLQCC